MIKEIIDTNLTVKAMTLTGSSGMMSLWFFDITEKTLGLGVLGFIISVFSFLHDYSHSDKNKSYMEIFTEMGKYIIFGVFAFPASYDFLSRYIQEPTILVMGGVFTSFFIVTFLDVAVSRGKEFISNWRKR